MSGDEQVLIDVDGVYRWDGPRMKATIIGAPLGRLVLTDRRLLFLTSGRNDLGERVLVAASGGLQFGRSRTGQDLGALANPASTDLPVAAVTAHGFTKKAFKSWLTVAGTDARGRTAEYSFSTKNHLPGGVEWAESIDRLRRGSRPGGW